MHLDSGIARDKKIDELQFLKGIAILLVVLVHTNLGVGDIHIVLEQLIRVGRWGCQLFFIISGFQLMLSCDKRKNNNNARFFLKRFIRIAPSYYLAIVFYGLLNLVTLYFIGTEKYCFTIKKDWISILMNVLLLHSFDANSYNYVVPGGWYIGTQWILYLCFPLFVNLYRYILEKRYRKKIIRILPILALFLNICIQTIIALFYGNVELSNEGTCLFYSAINNLPCFLIGMTMYCEFKDDNCKNISILKALSLFVGFGFVASVMYYFMWKIPLIFSIIPTLYGIAFVGLIIGVFQIYYRFSNKKIVNYIVKWGGGVSFGAYYANPVTVIFLPWLCVQILNLGEVNQTKLYLILLVPMFVTTYYLGYIVNELIDRVNRKVESLIGLR